MLNTNVFINAVCGESYSVTKEDYKKIQVDALCEDIEPYNLMIYYQENYKFLHETQTNYLFEKSVGENIRHINSEVAKWQLLEKKNPDVAHMYVVRLQNSTKEDIEKVKTSLPKENVQRQLTSDALANALLSASIAFYNNTNNVRNIAEEALELMEYAKSIAEGTLKIDECERNIQIVKSFVDKLPPRSIRAYVDNINSTVFTYSSRSKTIDNAIQLMRDCSPNIIKLKTVIEGEKIPYMFKKLNTHLCDVSTNVISTALSMVIHEVNDAIDNKSPMCSSVIDRAWDAVVGMDEFDVDSEFNQKRYLPNRETLCESKWGITKGHEIRKTHKIIDLRTEEELWKDCCSLEAYNLYLFKYPFGKHSPEARRQLERIEKEVLAEELRASIERKRKEEEKKKMEAEDERMWETCKSEDDYHKYLMCSKCKLHYKDAQDKLKYISGERTVLRWIIAFTTIALIPTVSYTIGGQEVLEDVGTILFVILVLLIVGFIKEVAK